MFPNLSFSQFKAYFRVLEPLHLPKYTGSTFRGALGHAMRKLHYGLKKVCTECEICPQCRYTNLYAYFFESPADHPFIADNSRSIKIKQETYPQPFILEPPAGGLYLSGEFLPLSFTLVGKAIECFPFMACALSNISHVGIARKEEGMKIRGKISLEAIVDAFPLDDGNETLIYDGRTGSMVGPGQILDFDIIKQSVMSNLNCERPVERIRISFLTPLRFKNENRLGEALTFNVFIRNILRRLTLLSVHSPLSSSIDFRRLISLAESVKTEKSQLRWFDWERYSARQKGKMKLGGFVGDIVFAGNLNEFLPYIKMCEFLNVGKNCTFGLGKYEIETS